MDFMILSGIIMLKLKYKTRHTAHNRTVYASAQKRLGLHSARSPKGSHASLRKIGGGGLASQALICRRQLRKQPERYAPFELVENFE